MPQCPVCYKDIYSSKLKTIGDQMVCSLSCVGLLNGNETDSCQYCKRPVWKDNYYKINNKICCSEFCRDIILEKLNIPKNSNIIKHFQENIFMNINSTILKNTKQLREEVLKVYNDFQFDSIEDSNKMNKSPEKNQINKKIDNNNEIELNNINKNINIKEHKSANDLSAYIKKFNHNNLLNYNSNINNSKRTKKIKINIRNPISIDKYNNITEYWSNDKVYDINNSKNSNNKSHEVKLTNIKNNYTSNNIHINRRNGKNCDNYYSNYNYKNTYDPHVYYNDYKYANKTVYTDNNIGDNNFYDYNNMNQYLNYGTELRNRNKSYNLKNNLNGNNNNYYQKNLNTEFNNNIIKLNVRKNNNCKTCLRKIGNTKFLDRSGNIFCSDYCKTRYMNRK